MDPLAASRPIFRKTRRVACLALGILQLTFVQGCALHRVRPSSPTTIRVAFGSCIKKPQTPAWSAIREAQPDLMLFLGDNIYQGRNEFGNEAGIRALYRNLFTAPGMSELRRDVPMLAIWDDHDFGPNNSDSSYAQSDLSLRIFREVWDKNPSPPAEIPTSVAFETRLGAALILALDDRTFRVPPGRSTPPAMFGDAQMTWLESRLSAPDAPLVIIAAGNQFLPIDDRGMTDQVEMLSQYRDEYVRLLNAIDSSPAEIILISGDRHYAEVLSKRIGPKTVYEFISSPISAPLSPSQWSGVEKIRRAALFGYENFGLLTIDTKTLAGEIEFRSPNGKTLLTLPFSLAR